MSIVGFIPIRGGGGPFDWRSALGFAFLFFVVMPAMLIGALSLGFAMNRWSWNRYAAAHNCHETSVTRTVHWRGRHGRQRSAMEVRWACAAGDEHWRALSVASWERRALEEQRLPVKP